MAHSLGTIQRKVSTIIEEFKRARDTWSEINSHAFPAYNTLCNSVIQSRYVDESQYWHPQITMEFPNIIQKFDAKMQVIIERQNQGLLDLVEKLGKQYTKMQNQYREFCALEQHTSYNGPIFQTCTFTVYLTRMKAILEMYANELKTKKSMLHNGVKEMNTREEAVVMLSIWINQPGLVKSILQEWDDICTTEIDFS